MVVVTGPLKSVTARGTWANEITYQRRRYRNVAYPYTVSRDPRTDFQILQRTIYYEGVQAWNALNPEEKETYNVSAQYQPYTGFNLFMKEFLKLETHGKLIHAGLIQGSFRISEAGLIDVSFTEQSGYVRILATKDSGVPGGALIHLERRLHLTGYNNFKVVSDMPANQEITVSLRSRLTAETNTTSAVDTVRLSSDEGLIDTDIPVSSITAGHFYFTIQIFSSVNDTFEIHIPTAGLLWL